MDVITYPCWDFSLTMLVKGVHGQEDIYFKSYLSVLDRRNPSEILMDIKAH